MGARACSARQGRTDRGTRARQGTPRDRFPLAWAGFCRSVGRRRARAPSPALSALRYFLLFFRPALAAFFTTTNNRARKREKKQERGHRRPRALGHGRNTHTKKVGHKRDRKPNADRQQRPCTCLCRVFFPPFHTCAASFCVCFPLALFSVCVSFFFSPFSPC
ncbi:hypothetical protein [Pandoravirus japonicus]|uniref:Transmembrane protein n=1 Tax=Pandoravirus japonicus TaxID=2823154 RepID=A0A811BSA7_9VIRU|nr:hypothetical protein [Pandoravirus japonicus]